MSEIINDRDSSTRRDNYKRDEHELTFKVGNTYWTSFGYDDATTYEEYKCTKRTATMAFFEDSKGNVIRRKVKHVNGLPWEMVENTLYGTINMFSYTKSNNINLLRL